MHTLRRYPREASATAGTSSVASRQESSANSSDVNKAWNVTAGVSAGVVIGTVLIMVVLIWLFVRRRRPKPLVSPEGLSSRAELPLRGSRQELPLCSSREELPHRSPRGELQGDSSRGELQGEGEKKLAVLEPSEMMGSDQPPQVVHATRRVLELSPYRSGIERRRSW